MPKNYTNLVENVKKRSNPGLLDEAVLFNKSYSDELRNISTSDLKVLEYVKRAMQAVDATYTSRTIEAGDKIKEHLKKNNPSLDFEYQGSVMCNTHIKGYSDIDLIQITGSFYSHENITKFNEKYNSGYSLTSSQRLSLLNVINATSYQDDANYDLRKIRINAENILTDIYKYVDTSKAKSIEVNPTNPDRKVDVVTASWYKTVESEINNSKEIRGIQVYDKDKNMRLSIDYPFLKILLLNEKDRSVNGRLKKMIRFLKTLKADSDYDLKGISSFDLSSICYNINTSIYKEKAYYELVTILFLEFKKIIEDDNYRNSIMSIDKTEFIFAGKDEKVRLLKLIYSELSSIYIDVLPKTLSMFKFL